MFLVIWLNWMSQWLSIGQYSFLRTGEELPSAWPKVLYFYMCVCVCVCVCVYAQSLQLCLTLCNPRDCSPPGSSVHGILQARILEWVAISSSRGSSPLRNRTCISCTAGQFFTVWPIREAEGPYTSALKYYFLVRFPTYNPWNKTESLLHVFQSNILHKWTLDPPTQDTILCLIVLSI